MSDKLNTIPAENGDTSTGGEKTFTQEQVNAIVSKRLSEEKSKTEATFAQREQAIQQRETLVTAKEKLTEKGLPLTLLEAVNTSSPEALEKSLSILESHINNTAPQPPPMAGGMSFSGMKPIGMKGDPIREAMGLQK